MQITCHVCGRTGEAANVFDIVRRTSPPMPQFVVEGKEIGLPAKLAWCTLCPPLPPSVTKIARFGGTTPFTAMPEIMMVPMVIMELALRLMKSGMATSLGQSYFHEISQQRRGQGGA